MSRRIAFADEDEVLVGNRRPATQNGNARLAPARPATTAPRAYSQRHSQQPVQLPHPSAVLAREQYLNAGGQRSHTPFGYTIPAPHSTVRPPLPQPLPPLPPLAQRTFNAVPIPAAPARDSGSQSRSHVCDLCGTGFSREHDLKRHRSAVHFPEGSSVPICHRCGRPFGHPESLRRHIQRGCTFIPPEDSRVLPPTLDRRDPSGYFSS